MADYPTKIDLGCGEDKKEGYLGVDIIDTAQTDLVMDLDQDDWDLPDDHFDQVRAKDIFEHLENPLNFMEEVHRICSDGARLEMRCPHLSSNNWVDPTHRRLVGTQTFEKYFTAEGMYSYYTEAEFEVLDTRIEFVKNPVFPWNYIMEPLVNLNRWTQLFFEYSFLSRIFPAQGIRAELEIVKP